MSGWLLAVGASALFTAPRVRVLSPPPVHAALRSTHPTALALPPTTLLPAGLLPAGLLPEAVALNTVLFGAFGASGASERMLTPSGFAHAWALGVILWSTLGWRGFVAGVAYLLCGSAVTKVGRAKKEALGISEGRGGRRGPENVWGSAATAALCALAYRRAVLGRAVVALSPPALLVGVVASLATKLGDTFASEIGKAYGRTTYLSTTFRRVPPGTEGAVSLEGTLAGVGGSLILAGYGVGSGLMPAAAALPTVLAAWIANNVESIIGATAQGKQGLGWLTNEVVNFINTLVGAAAAIGLCLLTGAV